MHLGGVIRRTYRGGISSSQALVQFGTNVMYDRDQKEATLESLKNIIPTYQTAEQH